MQAYKGLAINNSTTSQSDSLLSLTNLSKSTLDPSSGKNHNTINAIAHLENENSLL